MAFVDLINASYTSVADTAFGNAGTTTGAGNGLVDQFGNGSTRSARVLSNVLRISHDDYALLFKRSVYLPGSDAQQDSEVEVLVPPMVNGDGITLLARLKDLPNWAGNQGAFALDFFAGDQLGTGGLSGALYVYAISNETRGNPFLFTSNNVSWFSTAKSYWVRLRATGSNPTTLTATLWENNAGAHGTQVFNQVWTCGSGGSELTEAAYDYLQTPGFLGLCSNWNGGYSSVGASPAKFQNVRMAVQSATPPLTAAITLTSQTSTQNTLTVTEAGGVTPRSRTWHTAAGPDFTAGSGNQISGQTGTTLVHAHAAETRPIAGLLRFYKAKTTDNNSPSSTVVSDWLMAEDVRPAWPTLTIRPDILSSRKLLYYRAGDSISTATTPGAGTPVSGTTVKAAADALSSVYGIPSANVVARYVACPGAQLLADWQPNSPAFDVAAKGSNGYANGLATNLLDLLCDDIAAQLAANAGALVVVGIQLGTNDLQNYTTGMTPSVFVQGFRNIVTYIHTTRNLPSVKIVIDGTPFGTAGTINVPEKVAAYAGWRSALLTEAWPANVYNGTHRAWQGVYDTPNLLQDGIHYTSQGQTQLGAWWAEGTARGALAAATLTGITVTHDTIDTNGKIQFNAAAIPADAVLDNVIWSVVSGGGSMNASGLGTPPAPGAQAINWVVRAASNGVQAENTVVIAPVTPTSGMVTLSPQSVADIAEAILDKADGIETGLTLRQTLRLTSAVLFGRATRTQNGVQFLRPDGETVALTVDFNENGARNNSTIGTV